MRYLIAYHEINGKGFSDTEPFIYDDFENDREDCLQAASYLVNEGYSFVTPFIVEEKWESYDWKYVNEHKLIKVEE